MYIKEHETTYLLENDVLNQKLQQHVTPSALVGLVLQLSNAMRERESETEREYDFNKHVGVDNGPELVIFYIICFMLVCFY